MLALVEGATYTGGNFMRRPSAILDGALSAEDEYRFWRKKLKSLLNQYFSDPTTDPKKMGQFLKFGTGTTNPKGQMKFTIIESQRRPGAHTCFLTIDISIHSMLDYETFKSHLDEAIVSDDLVRHELI